MDESKPFYKQIYPRRLVLDNIDFNNYNMAFLGSQDGQTFKVPLTRKCFGTALHLLLRNPVICRHPNQILKKQYLFYPIKTLQNFHKLQIFKQIFWSGVTQKFQQPSWAVPANYRCTSIVDSSHGSSALHLLICRS